MPRRRIDPVTGEPISSGAPFDANLSGVPGAPRRRRIDPATGEPAGPPTGMLDVVKNMSGRDWLATGVRGVGGWLSNASAVPGWGTVIGAGAGGISEGLAQLIEGRGFRPMSIASSAALGAVPLGKLAGAANVLGSTVKGAGIGAGTTTVDRLISEGRLPTQAELTFGAATGGGGGALGSAILNRAGKTPVPSPGPSGRILTGRDQYNATYNPDRSLTDQLLTGPTQRAPRPDSFEDLIQRMEAENTPRLLTGEDRYSARYPQRTMADPAVSGQGLRQPRQDYLDELMAMLEGDDSPRLLTGANQYRSTGAADVGFDSPALSAKRKPYIDPSFADQRVKDPTAWPSDPFGEFTGAKQDKLSVLEDLFAGGGAKVSPPMTVGARPGAPQVQAAPAVDDLPDLGMTIPEYFTAPPGKSIRKFSELSEDEQREFRRALAEMQEFGFERGMGAEAFEDAFGERLDQRTGWRAGLLPHKAGAPVFHDIGGSGTRAATIAAMQRFEQGGRLSPINQRAVDVIRRRLAGDPSLSRPMLPPDAGDVRPVTSWDDNLAAIGAEPISPPGIPDEITNLWANLKPKWQQSVDAQKNDGIPFTVDPTEELEEFARRLATSPRESLWNAERKVVDSIPPDKFDMLRRFFAGGDESGTGEAGGISRELLYDLGGAGAGASLSMLPSEENKPATALGGAFAGFLLSRGIRNPKLIRDLTSSSLFSGAAIPKSAMGGGIGGWGSYGLENPEMARELGRQIRSPQTIADLKEGFRNPMAREGEVPTGPLSYAIRALSGPDQAVRGAINRAEALRVGRAPMSKVPANEVGGYYGMSGDPWSSLGKRTLGLAHGHEATRQMIPVVRTPINVVERGLERLPWIGGTETVRNWTGPTDALAKRRQALGALALLAGGGAGAAASLTDTPVDNKVLPYATAALGPYGLPALLGIQGGKRMFRDVNKGGHVDPLAGLETMTGEIQDSLPLPSDYGMKPKNWLRRLIPYGGLGRALSPREEDLDTSGSTFGPMLSQVPFLNELLFPRKPKPRKRVQFTRRDSQAP